MKVGILTLFHGNYNWGGVLQGYALKTLLETTFLDTKADLLLYHGKNVIYNNKLRQVLQYSPADIVRKTIKLVSVRGDAPYKGMLEPRYALFRSFMDEFTTNPRMYNDETLAEAAQEYDCLISGSDQVWNPNVGRAGFFQQMISDECKKIAYAASISRDDLSMHERNVMLPLIERFDAVSVREKTAKKMLEQYSSNGLRVSEVLDPVMMLSRENWETFARKSAKCFDGRYAVAFFFSESSLYRTQISDYCKKHHLELKFIPFACGEYVASDEHGDADRLYDLGPYEFVRLFQNAQCVFTDSFHGAVFSVIFQKQFCVFERDKKSKVSKNSRLYDLLGKFRLLDRMIHDISALEEVIGRAIDYTVVSRLHEQYKKESMDFLLGAIGRCPVKRVRTVSHVGDMEKRMCCGCELCAAVCPQKCITMCEDNEGFAVPHVDESVCTKCGRCLNACHGKRNKVAKTAKNAYIGFHKNEKIRVDSSSGGLFYGLAASVLRDGGCVYGAAYTDELAVSHLRITKIEELPLLMTSKYVQSRMGNVFAQVLQDLENGRRVLFSGTPCQVAAMSSFIGQKHRKENLLLVDFICHGVPSPGVWRSYIRYLEDKAGAAIQSVTFRDKCRGWHDYHFKVVFPHTVHKESHERNAYMYSFLSNKNLRRSCYECSFKNEDYFSDITLGDAWKIEKDYPAWADDKGVSFFVVRTDRGRELLGAVEREFVYRTANYEAWTTYNPSLVVSAHMPEGRKAFFEQYDMVDFRQFWKAQKRIPLKKVVRYGAKRAVRLLGAEKILRKIMR